MQARPGLVYMYIHVSHAGLHVHKPGNMGTCMIVKWTGDEQDQILVHVAAWCV